MSSMLYCVLACALHGSESNEMDASEVWATFQRIAAAGAPIESGRLGQQLGAPLVRSGETTALDIYRGAPTGAFREVSAMVPKPAGTVPGSITLGVDPRVCPTRDEARVTFGFLHREPASPHGTTRTAEYWAADVGWASLVLGFDPGSGCLLTASFLAR
jgi:hypothetical protein